MCVDDFSRSTWVDFITEKSNTFDVFIKLFKKVKNEHDAILSKLRVIMEKNFKTLVLKNIVIYMEFHINFPHLLLHNNIVLSKEKIGLYKKWLE